MQLISEEISDLDVLFGIKLIPCETLHIAIVFVCSTYIYIGISFYYKVFTLLVKWLRM